MSNEYHTSQCDYCCGDDEQEVCFANARPGDVVLVSRRSTFWQWVRHPISSTISARIRSSTGSKWSHVACYIGGGYVVEAEWNKGVVRTNFASDYHPDKYEWKVVSPPERVDREAAVAFWNIQYKGKATYDHKALIAMRVNAMLWGHDGIKRYAAKLDSQWICSELAAAGWFQGGMMNGLRDLLVPGDFDQEFQAQRKEF